MHSVLTEDKGRQKGNHPKKKMKKKRIKKDEKQKTEQVLCSEDWRDIVIMHVPQLNNIPIEDNYAEIPQKEIKEVYKQYKRRVQMKREK